MRWSSARRQKPTPEPPASGGTASTDKYGSLFTIPVSAWKVSYEEGGAKAYEWYPSEVLANTRVTELGAASPSVQAQAQEGYVEVLGLLYKVGEQLKSKYAALDFTTPGSLLADLGAIDIPGDVVANFGSPSTYFVDVTSTPVPRRLSLAVLPDQLFVGTGSSVEISTLASSDLGVIRSETSSSMTVSGVLVNNEIKSLSLTAGNVADVLFLVEEKETPTGPPPFTFTKITSISVLKVADDKFYLALGEAGGDDSNGRVVVFSAASSEFTDSQKSFHVSGQRAGDYFGWSVRLQLLDRDGGLDVFSPEPVLFVGAPKANSGVGYVRIVNFDKTIVGTLSSTDANVRAFGYSLGGGVYEVENYLLVGAPESVRSNTDNTQVGAVFVYKWFNGGDKGDYALKETVKADDASGLADSDGRHFGASVQYFTHRSHLYFFVMSYNARHTRTAISTFSLSDYSYDSTFSRYTPRGIRHLLYFAGTSMGSDRKYW